MKEKNNPSGSPEKNAPEKNTAEGAGHGSHKSKRKMNSRQAVAIAGIALLAFLYLASLAAAVLDSSSSAVWFRASLFGTVALPILIWLYVWLYGKMTGRHTMADAPEKPDGEKEEIEQNK